MAADLMISANLSSLAL